MDGESRRSGAGALGQGFPVTRLSLVRALASFEDDVRRPAFDALVAGYWRPSYKYLRVRWRLGPEDAEDLVQEFFTRVLEKRYFDAYDPGRSRFRTYLRTCLDRFVAKERRAAGRLKRGGGAPVLPLDFAGVERELEAGTGSATAAAEADPETWFRREWRRALFARALADLRARCRDEGKEDRFAVFERYDLRGGDGLTYARLGEELGLPVTQVTNHLSWARRELRRTLLDRLRELCGSEQEVAAEARELLGEAPP